MTDYTTMRVPTDQHDAARDAKERLGLTWGEYLQLATENAADVTTDGVDVDALADALADRLDTDADAPTSEAGVDEAALADLHDDVKNVSVMLEQLGHRVERVEDALQR